MLVFPNNFANVTNKPLGKEVTLESEGCRLKFEPRDPTLLRESLVTFRLIIPQNIIIDIGLARLSN